MPTIPHPTSLRERADARSMAAQTGGISDDRPGSTTRDTRVPEAPVPLVAVPADPETPQHVD